MGVGAKFNFRSVIERFLNLKTQTSTKTSKHALSTRSFALTHHHYVLLRVASLVSNLRLGLLVTQDGKLRGHSMRHLLAMTQQRMVQLSALASLPRQPQQDARRVIRTGVG